MNFTQIQTFVCAKVSKTDAYSQARCMDYILARNKMIYEGYDWKTAQILVDKTISPGANTTTLAMPEVHHCLAVRLDGVTLDPASPSFIFDNTTGTTDSYTTPGKPLYYDELFTAATGVRSIRFFPPLLDDSTSHSLSVLGKAPYNESSTAPTIPQTESALIAFVVGDMWEYLHQVGKAQAKFTEGQGLLTAAQGADTPSPQRARLSKVLTPTGNSLAELTDAVCDIVGDWMPPTRISIKDRIRRNYHKLWDSALWPETSVSAYITAKNNIVILPELFDKVLGARISVDASSLSFRTLDYADTTVFLGLQPSMFEQLGSPVNYSLILPVAMPGIVMQQAFKLKFTGSDKANVFLKGESNGVEAWETVAVSSALVQTINNYDTVFTLQKPVTNSSLQVQDLAGNVLMTLGGGERGRKYPRIMLYPAFDPSAVPAPDQTVFVLAKRKCPMLMDDGDTCQLTSVENILISAAAADMLLKGGKADIAATYQQEAASNLAILVDRETKQQAYAPRVIPYTEPSSFLSSGDCIGFQIP